MLVPIPLFSIILYFTDKHNPGRLIYSFSLYDALSFTICIIIAFFTSRFLFLRDANKMKYKYFSKDNDFDNEDEKDFEPQYLTDESLSTSNDEKIEALYNNLNDFIYIYIFFF